MSSEIAIKVENLSKCFRIYGQPHDRLKQSIFAPFQRLAGKQTKQYFKEFWALKEVSFEIKKGETVGIIGRNGSGKSTLLQILCGTLNQTSGSFKTTGRIAALLELGSGFNPEFTGRENVYLNATILGLSREEINARFDDILKFADIGDHIEQPVKSYSSGMMLRLAFAVIAHVNADILVIDEALAVGDAFFTQKCMRFLRTFMKEGTVLFVSHDMNSLRSLCSRVIWIEKGVMIQQGLSKEICENYLEAFYEAQQGKANTTRLKIDNKKSIISTKDPRHEFINASNLRNDIKVFDFNSEAPSFGKGGAQIVSVQLFDVNGNALAWLIGGENVILRVEAFAYSQLDSPIIGFSIKDKLGQSLFGDNTWLSYMDAPVVCNANQPIIATFQFQMPRLTSGDYSINVAIANGTQQEHIQHHWIHDALYFKSESTSVSAGLIGIPMNDIKLEIKV